MLCYRFTSTHNVCLDGHDNMQPRYMLHNPSIETTTAVLFMACQRSMFCWDRYDQAVAVFIAGTQSTYFALLGQEVSKRLWHVAQGSWECAVWCLCHW